MERVGRSEYEKVEEEGESLREERAKGGRRRQEK